MMMMRRPMKRPSLLRAETLTVGKPYSAETGSNHYAFKAMNKAKAHPDRDFLTPLRPKLEQVEHLLGVAKTARLGDILLVKETGVLDAFSYLLELYIGFFWANRIRVTVPNLRSLYARSNDTR